MTNTTWIEQIVSANANFQERIAVDKLPTTREPGQVVITCMDPRVNLEAIGIPSFAENGAGASSTRVIRTLGAMAEYRSLIVGIYLAGFREVVIVMHTDCGCCLAYSKVDTIIERMQSRLSAEAFDSFTTDIGTPLEDNLRDYLKAFQDPYDAVKAEVEHIKNLSFLPDDLIVHGLVYDLNTGKVDVVVNGYDF